jgi:hypothetical protein
VAICYSFIPKVKALVFYNKSPNVGLEKTLKILEIIIDLSCDKRVEITIGEGSK